MTPEELDAEDNDVPELIVQALDAGFRRAWNAGHELVYVQDNKLVRRLKNGDIVVLKSLPHRPRVDVASAESNETVPITNPTI